MTSRMTPERQTMSNYVKLATLSSRSPLDLHTDARPVDRLIDFWRSRFDQVLPDQPDLIAVPECCDRLHALDATKQKEHYCRRGDLVRALFSSIASENRCYITYSAMQEMADGTFRNSVQLIDRAGEVAACYSKTHPTIDEIQQGGVLCGRDAVVIETDFGRVGFAICFDLNFEAIRRKYESLNPELMVFVSMYHGGLMQPYWAYSLRCHLLTAIEALPSGVISPVGQTLAMTSNYCDHVTVRINLDCAVVHLDQNGQKCPAIKRRYGEAFRVVDPGYLGAVLISSESEQRSIHDLISEFGLERLDQYFSRALAVHADPANIEPATVNSKESIKPS